MNTTKVKIESLIDAPISKVWEYWTEPAHIVQWNFADPSWCCPVAENDLRPGGKYLARMEAKDGSFGFDFKGVYDEVVRHEKIGYTITDGRKVETLFAAEGEKVRMTTLFDAESQNPVEMQQQGWQAILNNFKAYVETAN